MLVVVVVVVVEVVIVEGFDREWTSLPTPRSVFVEYRVH